MRIGRFFYDLLFPPRCISCRSLCKKDILDPCEAPFCEKCRLEWEKEKTVSCAGCGKELLSCRCTSPRMERAGIVQSVKLVFYQSTKDTVGRRAVLHLRGFQGKTYGFATCLVPIKAKNPRDLIRQNAFVGHLPDDMERFLHRCFAEAV